jgi:hypothetical protein
LRIAANGRVVFLSAVDSRGVVGNIKFVLGGRFKFRCSCGSRSAMHVNVAVAKHLPVRGSAIRSVVGRVMLEMFSHMLVNGK